MRVGFNGVIIEERNSGAKECFVNFLDHIPKLRSDHDFVLYFARELSQHYLDRFGWAECVRTPLSFRKAYQRVLRGIVYWRKQLRRDDIDVFHSTYYPIPPMVDTKTVLTVHDVRLMRFPETYSRARYWFLKLAVPYSVKRADKIIADSDFTKEELVKLLGVPREKIAVVHPGANPRFKPIRDQTSLKRVKAKLSLPDRFVLFVGHLEPRKNLARLVEAFSILKSKTKLPHKLVILGRESWGYEPVFEAAERHNECSDIVFTGYVDEDDLPLVYNLADALAFPSLYEGFGLPLLEAMACGVPVVTSKVSSLPEVAGKAAILVDPYNVEEIADGLAAVLEDEALRQALINKGLDRAKKFRWEEAAAQIIHAYEEVISE